MRLVPLAHGGDQWCYEIRTPKKDPLVSRLLAYLARENLPYLSSAEGGIAKIGPLHAEQALQFESHWRPFVA